MKVTAAVLDQIGSEFTLKTLDLADPGPGEVLIEVAGVGVCHTDLAVQHGHLPFPFPAVLGHEGSGVVKSVGPGVTKSRAGTGSAPRSTAAAPVPSARPGPRRTARASWS